jgi:nucleotide-binding universal stress UspA family protein
MPFHTILLPVDGGPDTQTLVDYSYQIAYTLGAELQLLHVARTSAESSSSQRRPVQRFIGRGSFIAYDTHAVVLGKPAERIVRYADEIDADLIIMPSRRYGTLRQLIFGSTTMDVVRLTTRSVWIVTRQSLRRGATLTCRRIVCGIDLSSEGQPVMKYADTLAVGCAADLVFVHAIPGLSDAVLAAYGLGEPEDVAVLPTAAHQKVTAIAATAGITRRVDVSISDTVGTLHHAATRYSADLVVIGRGTHTNPLRLSAKVGDIITRLSCPVLTVGPRFQL